MIDTVALPIEQQVNGVEDMPICSPTRSRRQLFADGDLQDRAISTRAGAGANRSRSPLSQPPIGSEPGVTVQKGSTAICCS